MSERPKTKSSLLDLNEYLFETLDRISNDDLEEEKLKEEIDRTTAITTVAKTIVDNAAVILKAAIAFGVKDPIVYQQLLGEDADSDA